MAPRSTKGEYIETETGNKVSRRSHILGTQNIILGGKTVIQADCTIRGDLHRTPTPGSTSTSTSTVAISIGRYCILSPHSVLRPPSKLYRGHHSYYPLKMGDHVFVGEGAVIEAASIGSHVHVGAGVVIGRFVIIKDAVSILDGAVLPPGMVVPAFSIVGGRPARVLDDLPDAALKALDCRERYRAVR